MRRKISKAPLIALSVCVILALFWLGMFLADELSGNIHGEPQWVEAPDGESSLLSYRENTYSKAPWLTSSMKSEDVEIGWQDGFPFPDFRFYTDGSEHPLYILISDGSNVRSVYVRSDYDFAKQAYTVKGTDIEFVPEEELTKIEDPASVNYGDHCGTLEFVLKDAPRLSVKEAICRDSHGGWYLHSPDGLWQISEELVQAMLEAGVISK